MKCTFYAQQTFYLSRMVFNIVKQELYNSEIIELYIS